MTAALEIEQMILRCLSDVVGPNFTQSFDPQATFFQLRYQLSGGC